MADLQRIQQVLDKLKAAKRSERSDVIDEYHALIKSGLTLEEGLRAIDASLEFPEPEYSSEDNRSAVIGYLADSRFPREHGLAAIPRILEIYPALSKDARISAIWLLMNIPEREGAEALISLFRQYFHEGQIPQYSLNSRYFHPPHVEVYFPELLDYAHLSSGDHVFSIWQICLKYCERKILKPERILSQSSVVLGEYRTLKARLLPVQSEADRTANYEYLGDRETAGLLLDLLRFFPTDGVKQELLAALEEYRDPVLLCWACVAALWLGLPVAHDVIESIAANDESRKPFYGMLKDYKRASLFPKKYRTKVAFAQSDMVTWLTYPTELGRVPDEIELTHTIADQTEDGTYEWFLFRFRSREWASEANTDPAKWMAGWSGPFLKDDPPGKVLTPGGTFSHFNDWDAKTPQDHIGLNDEYEDDVPHTVTVTPVTKQK